jgi:methylated-DNA-[protein]-cysteine S-methyltransferase
MIAHQILMLCWLSACHKSQLTTEQNLPVAPHLTIQTQTSMAKRFVTSATIQSPVGPMHLAAAANGLTCCIFLSRSSRPDPTSEGDYSSKGHAILHQATLQLHEYFNGTRHDFTVPVAPLGTAFQRAVWDALQATIPYGSTASYSDVAIAIHNPKAVRAVGMANNKNPICVIIPCHRVIGKNGAMVGYGAGLEIKEKLLKLEEANVGNFM